MEDSKRSTSKGKKGKTEQIDTSSKDTSKEFVEKMKKRATVKTYGIDNVSTI
jgi:hypothetical protein